jgi:adenylate cyclase
MGIAIHTGDVVVGNIGSTKRSKYGVVGRTINTTARIESFTVGGQVIVSPTLIQVAGRGLILGDEVEVHAKGMKEALRCRQLLGHEDHPELGLGGEADCTALAEPVPFQYVLLTGKHFNEQMEPAAFVALSPRQAVIEAAGSLPAYTNLLLRLEAEAGEGEVPDFYAKVIRPLAESGHRYVIHFTSVPPAVRARLNRLAGQSKSP